MKVAGTRGLTYFLSRARSLPEIGSDLDAATQAKINRVVERVEVLKQPVHKPLPVEKQIVHSLCFDSMAGQCSG